jgi:hypothetical protein
VAARVTFAAVQVIVVARDMTLAFGCISNTLPILMHQMRISTNKVSSGRKSWKSEKILKNEKSRENSKQNIKKNLTVQFLFVF